MLVQKIEEFKKKVCQKWGYPTDTYTAADMAADLAHP
jgi:hypothetical protein